MPFVFLRVMANENREGFKGDHLVAIETVAATVEAFGRGEIELEAVAKDTPKAHIYHVPAGASSIFRSLSTDLRKVASATTHGSRRPVRRRRYRGRHDVAGAGRDDEVSGAINLTTLVVGVVVFWA